jgi:6,7-dimethyl-8-ribityllumazine synthase
MAEPRRTVGTEQGDLKGARILVVEARFYDDIADELLKGATRALEAAGCVFDRLSVPGSLEIPPAITIALDAAESAGKPYEGAVALGCVIRGDTIHFEIVSHESARGLMDISRTRGVPIGNGILTVDNDAQHAPDLCINVLALNAKALPYRAHMLWASPPCTAFSVASIGFHWNPDGTPRTDAAFFAIATVHKTLTLIQDAAPQWWFIENPRGMLRNLRSMRKHRRLTVSYCQYGDTRMKPTDIWTNATWWQPKPPCTYGDSCHLAAPRGARTGTQGMVGAIERGRIPYSLFQEIFNQVPSRIEETTGV